jgi:hypothetical protein
LYSTKHSQRGQNIEQYGRHGIRLTIVPYDHGVLFLLNVCNQLFSFGVIAHEKAPSILLSLNKGSNSMMSHSRMQSRSFSCHFVCTGEFDFLRQISTITVSPSYGCQLNCDLAILFTQSCRRHTAKIIMARHTNKSHHGKSTEQQDTLSSSSK